MQKATKCQWSLRDSPLDVYKWHDLGRQYLTEHLCMSLCTEMIVTSNIERLNPNLHEALVPPIQALKLPSPPVLQPSSSSESVPVFFNKHGCHPPVWVWKGDYPPYLPSPMETRLQSSFRTKCHKWSCNFSTMFRAALIPNFTDTTSSTKYCY